MGWEGFAALSDSGRAGKRGGLERGEGSRRNGFEGRCRFAGAVQSGTELRMRVPCTFLLYQAAAAAGQVPPLRFLSWFAQRALHMSLLQALLFISGVCRPQLLPVLALCTFISLPG